MSTVKLQFVLGSDPFRDAVREVLLPEGGWTKRDCPPNRMIPITY